MLDNSKYYNSHDIMTYNAVFMFIVGGRGIGKTFNAKYTRIKHFIETGKKFIYLRRYKSELSDKDTFFTDIVSAELFPEWEFKVDGMRGYMRKAEFDDTKKNENPWLQCMYFVTLSNALTKKSVSYKDVDFIIFDEFIIEKGNLHYLSNELKQFLDFYNTVDRFDDRVRVMLLANAVTLVNPYFVGFHLTPRKGKRFTKAKKGLIVIEMCESEKFIQHVNTTKFGKIIEGTAYYDYAVGNKFKDDNDRLIQQKTEESIFWFAFLFDTKTIAVWRDFMKGNIYLTSKAPKNCVPFVLTRDDMEPNLLMIEKTSPLMRSVKNIFMQGNVYFDSIQTREFCNNVFDYIGLK